MSIQNTSEHVASAAHKQLSSADILLREAKRLHRVVTQGALSKALPILRRMQSANLNGELSLPNLFKNRDRIKRKHLLRLLAVEAGYPGWEQFKPILKNIPAETTKRLLPLNVCGGSTLNLWFSNEKEAQQYVQKQGGKVIKYGQQAVVIHE